MSTSGKSPSSGNKKSKKKAGGRPRVHIDLIELEQLCAMQATDEELAAWFRVTQKTIQNRKSDPSKLKMPADKDGRPGFSGTFKEIMDRGKSRGRISVRRALFSLAQSKGRGAVGAAIFLAKNLLGYRDVVEHTGQDGGPFMMHVDLGKLSEEQLLEAERLASLARKNEDDR